MLEAIALGDLPAEVVAAADDEHGLVAVLVNEGAEYGVRLDKLVLGDLVARRERRHVSRLVRSSRGVKGV